MTSDGRLNINYKGKKPVGDVARNTAS